MLMQSEINADHYILTDVYGGGNNEPHTLADVEAVAGESVRVLGDGRVVVDSWDPSRDPTPSDDQIVARLAGDTY